jgi:hypothetical protein
VKLLDYEGKEQQLDTELNPFAAVVSAHASQDASDLAEFRRICRI